MGYPTPVKAPIDRTIHPLAGKLDLIMVTTADCQCADEELRCCFWTPEDHSDLLHAARRFVALSERARLHGEKLRKAKNPDLLPKEPLYFSVHHQGRHILSVKIKAKE